jgi:CelD/BcsL family acetyltransferase involved in cellulose biosynthesis
MTQSRHERAGHHGVRYEWIERLEDVEALEPRWRALEDRVRDRMVFGSFDHVLPWYRHHVERYGSPLVGVAWRGRECAGILPLALNRTTLGGVPVRRANCVGHDEEDGEYLFAEGDGELLAGLLDSLLERGAADVIELLGIPPGGGRDAILESVISRRGIRAERTPYRYASVDLAEGYDAYEAKLGAKLRGNLRRRSKRAESLGGLEFDRLHRAEDPATVARYLGRIYAIGERSWKSEDGRGMRGHYRGFYLELAERFNARGLLDLSILKVGGRDAAFIFGIRERGVYYDVTISYDEEFAGVSPGTLLIQEVARRVAAEGIRLVVSHGDREYKRYWASGYVTQTRLTIFPPGVRSALSHFAKYRAHPWVRGLRGEGRGGTG